jgi:peptide/nickel transport system substrate-binding protein
LTIYDVPSYRECLKVETIFAIRWRNDEYDKAYRAAEAELDPVKRAVLFVTMNDLVIGEHADIPVVYRPAVSAMSRQLRASLSGWDNVLWDLKNWYREA